MSSKPSQFVEKTDENDSDHDDVDAVKNEVKDEDEEDEDENKTLEEAAAEKEEEKAEHKARATHIVQLKTAQLACIRAISSAAREGNLAELKALSKKDWNAVHGCHTLSRKSKDEHAEETTPCPEGCGGPGGPRWLTFEILGEEGISECCAAAAAAGQLDALKAIVAYNDSTRAYDVTRAVLIAPGETCAQAAVFVGDCFFTSSQQLST